MLAKDTDPWIPRDCDALRDVGNGKGKMEISPLPSGNAANANCSPSAVSNWCHRCKRPRCNDAVCFDDFFHALELF